MGRTDNVNNTSIRSPTRSIERYKHFNDRLSRNQQHLCQRHSKHRRWSFNTWSGNWQMRYVYINVEGASLVSFLPFRPDDAPSRGIAQTGVMISRARHEYCTVMPNSGTFHSISFYVNCVRVYIVMLMVITAVRCWSEYICCGQREFFARVDKIVVSSKASLCPRNYALHSIASITEKKNEKKISRYTRCLGKKFLWVNNLTLLQYLHVWFLDTSFNVSQNCFVEKLFGKYDSFDMYLKNIFLSKITVTIKN